MEKTRSNNDFSSEGSSIRTERRQPDGLARLDHKCNFERDRFQCSLNDITTALLWGSHHVFGMGDVCYWWVFGCEMGAIASLISIFPMDDYLSAGEICSQLEFDIQRV